MPTAYASVIVLDTTLVSNKMLWVVSNPRAACGSGSPGHHQGGREELNSSFGVVSSHSCQIGEQCFQFLLTVLVNVREKSFS